MLMSLIKRHLTRLLCFWTVLTCSSLSELHAQPSSQPAQEPRIQIALFKYHGATKGHPEEKKFDAFIGIIKQKLVLLRKEVLQTWPEEKDTGAHLEHLNHIHIRFRGEDNFGSDTETEINKLMENEPEILALMRGSIISDDGSPYIVHSMVYLGKLRAYLPYGVISVELPVESSEFKKIEDSHTVVILYALAMDAKSLGYPKDQILMYLKVVKDKIADLERRVRNRSGESLSGDLAVLQEAIQKAEDELLEVQ